MAQHTHQSKLNTEGKYLFFLLLCLLFWNPLSVSFLYGKSAIYTSPAFKAGVWLFFGFGLACILLIRAKVLVSERVLNLLLGLSFLGLFIGVLVGVNALLGKLQSRDKDAAEIKAGTTGLLFEPNTTAHYHTVEFDYKAEINSLGLRNREISIAKKPGAYRILCVGDSWTYGWGVDIAQSWPMQLETYLHEHGHPEAEVINCGKPGQFTTSYKSGLQAMLPLLKPDLVILGVLQLDDLAQLYEHHYFEQKQQSAPPRQQDEHTLHSTLSGFLHNFLHASFGHYAELLNPVVKAERKKEEIDIRKEWAQSANQQIQQFNYLQKLRFSTFPDTVQQLFRSGDLNASLLDIYIHYPDRLSIFNNPDNPATRFAAGEMNKDIKAIHSLCDSFHAQLLMANLPINDFTGHYVERTASDILLPFWVDNNTVDAQYQRIASDNGVPYLQLTDAFLELPDKHGYFFRFDGHPNARGYRVIATHIGDQLLQKMLKK